MTKSAHVGSEIGTKRHTCVRFSAVRSMRGGPSSTPNYACPSGHGDDRVAGGSFPTQGGAVGLGLVRFGVLGSGL